MVSSDIIGEHKRLARAFGESVWAGQFEDLRAMCTDDAVFHDPAFGPEGVDIERMVEHFERMHESMSDATYELIDVVAEDDRVFYRGRVTATHSGEFMGIAPTNRRVTADDHIELRFEDGKVAEAWAQYDMLGVMHQLGAEFPGAA